MLLIALPFARLAAAHDRTGGPAEYVAPFGPMAAFQTGWLYYVARITALAANANVFATYAATLWPPLGTTIGRGATIVALPKIIKSGPASCLSFRIAAAGSVFTSVVLFHDARLSVFGRTPRA